jgi:hypothetical protein
LKQFIGGSCPRILDGDFDTRGVRKFDIRSAAEQVTFCSLRLSTKCAALRHRDLPRRVHCNRSMASPGIVENCMDFKTPARVAKLSAAFYRGVAAKNAIGV